MAAKNAQPYLFGAGLSSTIVCCGFESAMAICSFEFAGIVLFRIISVGFKPQKATRYGIIDILKYYDGLFSYEIKR